jgi:predicted RNA-binding Zn ribbon-like protein
MRRKIVLWGTNEKEEKILVGLELLEKENAVHIYTFPASIVSEEFYQTMSDKWKDDVEIEFPTGFSKIEQKLSISDSILPDNIRVDRPDVVTRAQAEWHFVVLSSKLYELYRTELDELKDKIEQASQYDNKVWDELRSFWGKVQEQVNERNLFREHGASLRERANSLFDKMKELKKSLESEVATQSKSYVESFKQELQEIEDRIEKGGVLNPLFDELKKIQAKFKDFKFTREDRDDVWQSIDGTFKKLKEKRGGGGGGGAHSSGLENRYNGLLTAIEKMQRSVDFDQKDFDFENNKAANSGGQLESQLRQAKMNMISERINSKKEKLEDMHKLKRELEAKMSKEKKREAKVEAQEKVDEAKEVAKAKIAAQINEKSAERSDLADKLEKAAADLADQKKGKKSPQPKQETDGDSTSLLGSLAASAGAFIADIKDSVEAISEVLEDKIEVAMDKAEEVMESIEDKVEESIDKLKNKKESDDKSEEE